MELIHEIGADDLGVAQREELRASEIERIEAWDAGSRNRAGIRIVEGVVVDEVIRGELAHAVVDIHSDGTLVVVDGLRVGGG